ncbi:hypothetical protein Q1695_012928 [Nippostrongylus brasiliensis]|nr:hypothetical protein Q1695_012928 [Nippostrongylus brasiliensis]
MTQVICHDLNEVWDDISEFLDQENFRIGEMSSRLAFSPLETPTVGMLTRAPRVHEIPVREPITLSMPPPALPGSMFAPCSTPVPPPPRTYVSTCALAAANNTCSALPTTSTMIPSYYTPPPAPQPPPPAPTPAVPTSTPAHPTPISTPVPPPPPLSIKEESPPSSPEIPYLCPEGTYSRSPLANSLPDLNMPNRRSHKTSRYGSLYFLVVYIV